MAQDKTLNPRDKEIDEKIEITYFKILDHISVCFKKLTCLPIIHIHVLSNQITCVICCVLNHICMSTRLLHNMYVFSSVVEMCL